MQNKHVEAFDSALAALLSEVDHFLEARYGEEFPRHPARPAAGDTANPQYDGLFALVANFSAGIGSKYGPGYALTLRISTLSPVSEALQEKWEAIMVEHLRKRLPEVFPGRKLSVEKDRHGWKLFGDLSI